MQKPAVCAQDHEVAGIRVVGRPVGVKTISGEPSWFRSATLASEAYITGFPWV